MPVEQTSTAAKRGGTPWPHSLRDLATASGVFTLIVLTGIGASFGRSWRSAIPAWLRTTASCPPMTHSDIARAFVESHDDFVRIYDLENATGVWIPGKRWALGDPGDALLTHGNSALPG